MSTRVYTLPVDQTQWEIGAESTTVFNWEYDDTRDRLLSLYEKGKEKQWNTNTRLDWSIDVDPGSPDNGPDAYIPIFGSDMWERMDEPARRAFHPHAGGTAGGDRQAVGPETAGRRRLQGGAGRVRG